MKSLMAGFRLKKSIFVGAIVLLPIFIVLFILNMLIDIVSARWDPVFEFFGIYKYTSKTGGFAEVGATILLVYATGRFLTTKRIRTGTLGKLLRSLPIAGFFFRIAFGVIYAMEDLESFPVVRIQAYDGNFTYGFAVGIQKTRIHTTKGQKVQRLLRVYFPDFPAQINGRGGVYEFRRVDKVLNPLSECMSLFTTAYIAAPEWIDLQPWSDLFTEELENIVGNSSSGYDEVYHFKDLIDFVKKILGWRPSAKKEILDDTSDDKKQ